MLRYLRALWYYCTGRVDAARRVLSKNPYVVRSTYDNAIEKAKKNIGELSNAYGQLTAQGAQKSARLKELNEEYNKVQAIKTGAVNKAKEIKNTLVAQGNTEESVKTNPEYIQCLKTYQDYDARSLEVSNQVKQLEVELQEHQKRSEEFKNSLMIQKRNIEKLKSEKEETVADIIMADEEKKLNQMLAGVSTDSSDKDLEEMRELRQTIKAEAKVSRELAGTEVKSVENDYLKYANNEKISIDFNNLVGLGSQEVTKLPEA